MVIFCQNGINLFIFIMEMVYVFWEFGTEFVNVPLMNFMFWEGEGGGGVTPELMGDKFNPYRTNVENRVSS